MEGDLKKIRDLISNGEMVDAIEQLKKTDTLSYTKNRILLQCARYHILEHHEQNHDLSLEEMDVEKNQIIESLLRIVDSIENKEEIEEEEFHQLNVESEKKANSNITQLGKTTMLGLFFSAIGFILIILTHSSMINEGALKEETFWLGAGLLLASFLLFLVSRVSISPLVLNSYRQNKNVNRDLQLLFMHLTKVLRNAHDFSSSHIRNIEELVKISGMNTIGEEEKYRQTKDKLQELKYFSEMAGLFDETMNVVEDVEYAIVKSDFKDLNSHSNELNAITLKIKELLRVSG